MRGEAVADSTELMEMGFELYANLVHWHCLKMLVNYMTVHLCLTLQLWLYHVSLRWN